MCEAQCTISMYSNAAFSKTDLKSRIEGGVVVGKALRVGQQAVATAGFAKAGLVQVADAVETGLLDGCRSLVADGQHLRRSVDVRIKSLSDRAERLSQGQPTAM